METGRQVTAVDHGIVTHNAAFAHRAVEEHAVEADERTVADRAGTVDNRAVRDRSPLADGDCRSGLGVYDHTVLNVRMCTDDDGLHLAVCIHLVGADHGIGSDEDVLMDDHATAQNGRWIDKSAVMDNREIAAWIPANHRASAMKPADPSAAPCFTPAQARSTTTDRRGDEPSSFQRCMGPTRAVQTAPAGTQFGQVPSTSTTRRSTRYPKAAASSASTCTTRGSSNSVDAPQMLQRKKRQSCWRSGCAQGTYAFRLSIFETSRWDIRNSSAR